MRIFGISMNIKSAVPQALINLLMSIMSDRKINTGPAQAVAIVSNAITIADNAQKLDNFSHFSISATGGSTNLNSILGGNNGDLIFLKIANNSNAVVFKHDAANILCNGSADLTVSSVNDMMMAHYDGDISKWRVVLWTMG